MNTLKKSCLTVMLFVSTAAAVCAQDAKPAPKEKASPAQVAEGTINGATVKISYSSPAVKGRKIWGELVPTDSVWRAGANEATIFETDKELKIQGKTLLAGKYSLYAQTGEKEWKIIFNSQVGQWGIKRGGVTTRVVANDVVVATAKPMKSKTFNERLVYTVTGKGFDLSWENLTVLVTFK